MKDLRARFGGAVADVPVAGGLVRTESLGTGPALLLLHGWTLDRRIWEPQLALAGQMRLVLLDRRGFGQSTAPPDLACEPDDILAVAGVLGLGRFAIAAQSQGARGAIHAALRASGRVTRLTLFGAPLDAVLAPADPPPPLALMRAVAHAGDRASLAALIGAHPFMAVRRPAAAAMVRAMTADYAGRDLLAPPSLLSVTEAEIRRLAMPVEAVVGEHDTPYRRAAAEVTGRAARAGSHVVLEGAGHLCTVDRPEAVNALLAGAAVEAQPG